MEFNGTQRDTDFQNGDFLTWNWGASQYLPLDKQFHYLAELGVAGYSQWQFTDSSGPSVANPSFHDQVHGVGLQAGITNTRLGLLVNFRYMHEFYAANRFRGNSYSLNLGYTIKKPKPKPAPSTKWLGASGAVALLPIESASGEFDNCTEPGTRSECLTSIR